MSRPETERFTGCAESYNTGRPGYPPGLVDVVLNGLGDPQNLKIADIGAGTGLSSQLFTERGSIVYAIEPNAAMRAKGAGMPGVIWFDGTAEATGLPDQSIDVAGAFQAFHWFEPHAALAEMVRILRPTGRGVVVFYERDESDPFTAAYGDIVRRFATDNTEARRAKALENFQRWSGWRNATRTAIPNAHVLDRAGMAERVASSSYLPKKGAAADLLTAEVNELFDRYATDGRVRMALETLVVLTDVKR